MPSLSANLSDVDSTRASVAVFRERPVFVQGEHAERGPWPIS